MQEVMALLKVVSYLLVVSLVLPACTCAGSEPLVVNTTNGLVEGLQKSYSTQNVFQFIGIPYAEPPTGDLRFQHPRPIAPHEGVFKAQTVGPPCMQNLLRLLPNISTSEDCLVLNIYVPLELNSVSKRSVMVWIHGGGFTVGQGILYDGSYLALAGDVIVVTLNYRLGVFGFLSTGDTVAPGNAALFDQNLAIKWVHDNIANFGGNPDSVTIFGGSAGSISVGFHILSPLNAGLFKRAICESGTLNSKAFAFETDPLQQARRLGNAFNCSHGTSDTSNTTALIECLRKVSATNLHKVASSTAGLTFVPVMDGEFVTGTLSDVMNDENSPAYKLFSGIDLIAGTNSAEGGLSLLFLTRLQGRYNFNITEGMPTRFLCEFVAPTIAETDFNNNSHVSDAICEQFTVPNSDSSDFLQRQARDILNIYADLTFIVPTVRTLTAHSKATNKLGTYQYLFSHQSPFNAGILTRPPWLQGANHAEEVPFVFGLDAMYKPDVQKPTEERELSNTMMKYWSNFAKTGNPNGPDLPMWGLYNSTRKAYMNLSLETKSETSLYSDRMMFWFETVPRILSDDEAVSASTLHNMCSFLTVTAVIIAIVVIEK